MPKRDEISSRFGYLSMFFSENRFTCFRTMLADRTSPVRSAPLFLPRCWKVTAKMVKSTISVRWRLMMGSALAWKFSWRFSRIFSRRFFWTFLLAFTAVTAQAQQFSADIVTGHDDMTTRAGRLGVRDGKVRIETVEHTDGFFLVDAAKPSAWFVRPGARLYMDARQSSRLTRLFVPLDPDAPCSHWQAMARLAGAGEQDAWRCERTGEETIDGHSTVAFRALSTKGEELVGWIDRERRFPLRIRIGDGTLITLEQIKDEAEPASSFELPAGYRKFSPEALIERIKQSDVWVARPDEAQPSRP